jgi:hypothetical protein
LPLARAIIGRRDRFRAASSYGRPGMGKPRDTGSGKSAKLLAPLAIGDKLPWRLRRDGEPEWLVVVEVIDGSSYRVRYPDGTTFVLVDSE